MDECQKAFQCLKDHLTSPPVLGHPDMCNTFVVYTEVLQVFELSWSWHEDLTLSPKRSFFMGAAVCPAQSKVTLNVSVWQGLVFR